MNLDQDPSYWLLDPDDYDTEDWGYAASTSG